MTRVDFYILADADEAQRQLYLCRMVDKAYRLGLRIWIHAPSPEHGATLDDRLWTFSQSSFVAHDRAGADDATRAPVLIGDVRDIDSGRNLFVNEASDVPDAAQHFERVAEVVNNDPEVRRRGRAHFAYYREQGFELHHHRID